MKRINVILKYILGLLLTISIFFDFILIFSKTTVLNKNYIFSSMDKINYYENTYNTIKDNLIWSNMSSGFDDDILDNIFTIDDVKKDINTTIDCLYNNKKITINVDDIKTNLTNNINDYITINKIKVLDKKAVEEHVDELVSVYNKEITYYSYFNSHISIISKINKYANIALIIALLVTIILILIIKFVIKENIISAVFISVGLFMIFLYLHTIVNIEFDTITIISTNFSILLRKIAKELLTIYNVFSYIFVGFGLFLGVFKRIK